MAFQFMLKDESGRGITSKVEIDHILEHFGEMKNDENDPYEETVGEWAVCARSGDVYRLREEHTSIYSLDDHQVVCYKVTEGFGDKDDPSSCWNVKVVKYLDDAAEADRLAETHYESRISSTGEDWQRFWVTVERV